MLYYKIYSDNKGKLSYSKPVIVCIHGFASNIGIFAKQIFALRKKYDLVMIDLPSHGQTSIQLSNMEISFSSITLEILKILDELCIEKAHFIGCSLGTLIVKHFLTYHNERVDKSIMIGCVGKYLWCYNYAIIIGKWLLHFLPCQMCCTIIATIVMPSKTSNDVRKLFLACCKRIPKKEFYAWMTLFTKFPKLNKEYNKKIKYKNINTNNVLYISGDKDIIFLPTILKEMKNFSNSYILNNCGHICNFDKAKEVNNLIEMFLEKNN